MENLENRQVAIEYCKGIRTDMKKFKESLKPTEAMDELKKLCKISIDGELDLEKYPELKAELERYKAREEKALRLWEEEVQRVMKENNLTEEDIEKEEE